MKIEKELSRAVAAESRPSDGAESPNPSAATILKTESEYIEWAKADLGVDFNNERNRLEYRQTLAYAQNTFQEHPFSAGLESFLKSANAEYLKETHYPLLMTQDSPRFVQKPYASAVNKSFRQNYIQNRNFPNPPEKDKKWVTPANWFSKFNDLLRATIVCKYIDGPKRLAHALEKYATAHGLRSRSYSQQRDEGYYAYHFYAYIPLELMIGGGEPQKIEFQVEIQLTTQLQEVLRELTHRFYEHTRITKRERDTSGWKWEHQSSKFRTSYLSHTLHLLEALIVELRDGERSIVPVQEEESEQ